MAHPRTTPAKRGPKRSLSEDQILNVGLELLDAEGIDAVTLRRLAGELGVNPMTLYIYFDTKEALLQALCARACADAFASPDENASWDEQLARVIRGLHEALIVRPGVAEFLLSRHLRGPQLDQGRECTLAIMRSAGLGDDAAIDGTRALMIYALGSVIAETGRHTAAQSTPARADSRAHPVLGELEHKYVDRSAGKAFDTGLGLMIEGIRHTVYRTDR